MYRPGRRSPWLAAALLASLIAGNGSPARAEDPKPLTGPEIATLLVGNSIEGSWGGSSHFRSFFAPDGTTLYQPEGQPPEQGHWKVVGDQYCSVADDGDACFNLYRDGDSLIWEDPNSHARFPSNVIQGKAVPW
jgi:hypothetical protein